MQLLKSNFRNLVGETGDHATGMEAYTTNCVQMQDPRDIIPIWAAHEAQVSCMVYNSVITLDPAKRMAFRIIFYRSHHLNRDPTIPLTHCQGLGKILIRTPKGKLYNFPFRPQMQKRVGNIEGGKIFPKRQREERTEDTDTTKRKKMEETTVEALAEHPGYIIIKRENEQPPLKELFEALEREIGVQRFQDLRRSTSSEGGQKVDGVEIAEALLYHGIDVSVDQCGTGSSKLTS